ASFPTRRSSDLAEADAHTHTHTHTSTQKHHNVSHNAIPTRVHICLHVKGPKSPSASLVSVHWTYPPLRCPLRRPLTSHLHLVEPASDGGQGRGLCDVIDGQDSVCLAVVLLSKAMVPEAHTHKHTTTYAHTHKHKHHMHTHTHTHRHTHARTHAQTDTLTQTLTLTHSHTHSHTLTHPP